MFQLILVFGINQLALIWFIAITDLLHLGNFFKITGIYNKQNSTKFKQIVKNWCCKHVSVNSVQNASVTREDLPRILYIAEPFNL